MILSKFEGKCFHIYELLKLLICKVLILKLNYPLPFSFYRSYTALDCLIFLFVILNNQTQFRCIPFVPFIVALNLQCYKKGASSRFPPPQGMIDLGIL